MGDHKQELTDKVSEGNRFYHEEKSMKKHSNDIQGVYTKTGHSISWTCLTFQN